MTMGSKLQVICLTATPDDEVDDGCERKLMDLMKFKTIRTSDKKEFEEPVIETRLPLRCATEVIDQVRSYMETRAVLVYANGS